MRFVAGSELTKTSAPVLMLRPQIVIGVPPSAGRTITNHTQCKSAPKTSSAVDAIQEIGQPEGLSARPSKQRSYSAGAAGKQPGQAPTDSDTHELSAKIQAELRSSHQYSPVEHPSVPHPVMLYTTGVVGN